jgi:altronate dehydratase small subunit
MLKSERLERLDTAGQGCRYWVEQSGPEANMASKRMLIIHSGDNVGVVLENVDKGGEVVFQDVNIIAQEDIEFAHKISLKDITVGEEIIKYGDSIGYALKDIKKGECIHTHNMDCDRARVGRLV